MKLTAGSHAAADRERVQHGDDGVRHVTYETVYGSEEYSCKLSAGSDSGLGDAVAVVPKVSLCRRWDTTHTQFRDGQRQCFPELADDCASACGRTLSSPAATVHPDLDALALRQKVSPRLSWRDGRTSSQSYASRLPEKSSLTQ